MTTIAEPTTTDIVRFEHGAAALGFVHELGGTATMISLDMADPAALTYDNWVHIGRQLGMIGAAWQWWLGDWLNFGEALYGEEQAAAAVDDRATRYDIARRVTGQDQGTLQNIRSTCGRVAKSRRRAELSFAHHTTVAAQEPEDQERLLGQAVTGQLTEKELRQVIRDEKNPPGSTEVVDPAPEVESYCDRLEAICKDVWGLASDLPDGGYRIPDEVMSRVRAAIGDE